MNEVVGIRPDVTVNKSEARRDLEATSAEALDRADSLGKMLGMVIVVYALNEDGTLITVRRTHTMGDGAPACSFLEAKAAATLMLSSASGSV